MVDLKTNIAEIKDLLAKFNEELAVVESGKRNKAAGRRARKLSLELAKAFKDFRKISVTL